MTYQEWLDSLGLSDSILLAKCWQASRRAALEEAATWLKERVGRFVTRECSCDGAAEGIVDELRDLAQGGGA